MFRRYAPLVAFLSLLANCATADLIGGPERDGGGTARDSGGDVRPDASVDVAMDADTGDGSGQPDADDDGGDLDAPELADDVGDATVDASNDATADAPGEVDQDAPACVGVGCRCTEETATRVCGTLPCVDGYCCDERCDGTCRSCAVDGLEGTCSPVPEGTDPQNECSAAPADSCGANGACDGEGACALWAGSSCDDGESCSTNDGCDGEGACRGEVPETCGPGPRNVCCVGTCTDGFGCGTTPTPCPDVCQPDELTVGGACTGCGPAGGEGTCTGARKLRCDDAVHTLCAEETCGGNVYRCTNDGGTWAWRPAATCSDGNACTWGDVCVAGACRGTTIDCTDTECADRECNGTSACTVTPRTGATCSDGDACTWGDTCNAAGTCGGTSISCTDSACVDRECNGTSTCAETIRVGASCDDGNACTWGETCNPSAVCLGGTAISCDPLDTTCMDYACNGTSTCAGTPRNVGGACDDGNAETDLDACSAAGVCVGDTGCPPPAEACVAGTQNRRGCGGARTISRTAAGAGSGTVISDSLCSARDDWDEPSSSGCWDANNDHTYRIYMREGERLTARLQTQTACIGGSWQGTLKIIETPGCASTSCGSRVYCDYNETDQSTTYTAPRDGWVILTAEGSSAFDDEGTYRLTVSLTCRSGNCGCT